MDTLKTLERLSLQPFLTTLYKRNCIFTVSHSSSFYSQYPLSLHYLSHPNPFFSFLPENIHFGAIFLLRAVFRRIHVVLRINTYFLSFSSFASRRCFSCFPHKRDDWARQKQKLIFCPIYRILSQWPIGPVLCIRLTGPRVFFSL